MIGGFIVSGNVAHKVIARAIGPSLPVSGKMADPTLELFDANGTSIGFNNNWRSDQEAEIIATDCSADKRSRIRDRAHAGTWALYGDRAR